MEGVHWSLSHNVPNTNNGITITSIYVDTHIFTERKYIKWIWTEKLNHCRHHSSSEYKLYCMYMYRYVQMFVCVVCWIKVFGQHANLCELLLNSFSPYELKWLLRKYGHTFLHWWWYSGHDIWFTCVLVIQLHRPYSIFIYRRSVSNSGGFFHYRRMKMASAFSVYWCAYVLHVTVSYSCAFIADHLHKRGKSHTFACHTRQII